MSTARSKPRALNLLKIFLVLKEDGLPLSLPRQPPRHRQETAMGVAMHETAQSVMTANLEDAVADEYNWGVDSLEAPLFLMSATTLAKKLETDINTKVPRQSLGLSTTEAQARKVNFY